jgi:hypothetical protein
LIDVDGGASLEDEEIVPLLKAAGLDETNARAAARRLLGDQITVRARSSGCTAFAWLSRSARTFR